MGGNTKIHTREVIITSHVRGAIVYSVIQARACWAGPNYVDKANEQKKACIASPAWSLKKRDRNKSANKETRGDLGLTKKRRKRYTVNLGK